MPGPVPALVPQVHSQHGVSRRPHGRCVVESGPHPITLVEKVIDVHRSRQAIAERIARQGIDQRIVSLRNCRTLLDSALTIGPVDPRELNIALPVDTPPIVSPSNAPGRR
jgi:hypothetical protein